MIGTLPCSVAYVPSTSLYKEEESLCRFLLWPSFQLLYFCQGKFWAFLHGALGLISYFKISSKFIHFVLHPQPYFVISWLMLRFTGSEIIDSCGFYVDLNSFNYVWMCTLDWSEYKNCLFVITDLHETFIT